MLKLEDVRLFYRTRRGSVRAVDRVSFELKKGEVLGIVGESGCGKSSTALAIMRILPRNVDIYDGKILLDGVNLRELSENEFRENIRWKRISMVFQGALNALNRSKSGFPSC